MCNKFNHFYFLITQQYHSGLLQLELTVWRVILLPYWKADQSLRVYITQHTQEKGLNLLPVLHTCRFEEQIIESIDEDRVW